jgi:transcriptional regulator with XRE-family HTH domain
MIDAVRYLAGATPDCPRHAFDRFIGLARSVVGGASDARLDAVDRGRAIDSLEGDLDCLMDDAASGGIGRRSAEELLLTVAVLDWLRGGAPPGRGAVDFVEDHVALMNGAVRPDEEDLQRAFRRTLEVLVQSEAESIASARWSGRDLNQEAAAGRRLRRFGRKVDSTRRLRGLTIGDLADRADLDVLRVVAFILGSDEPDPATLEALSEALSLCPGQLIPPDFRPAEGWVDDELIGDLPDPDQMADAPEEGSEGDEVG